jgi:hypothetical protein
MKMFVVAIVFGTFSLLNDAHATWVGANNRSCDDVCRSAGRIPEASDRYRAGNDRFFVCRINVAGEGARPGFNLRPFWSNTCTVGYGSWSLSWQPYDCLCRP